MQQKKRDSRSHPAFAISLEENQYPPTLVAELPSPLSAHLFHIVSIPLSSDRTFECENQFQDLSLPWLSPL